MPRDAYVNGRFVPHRGAAVHIEDRGFQFADGVYEVITVLAGEPVDMVGHIDRLERSAAELRIAPPLGRRSLELVVRTLIRRNGLRDGSVYIQVTRGAAPRDFPFPSNIRGTLVMTTRAMDLTRRKAVENGVKVITVTDQRWKRRDIKTVGLLAQVLAKQAATEAGAFEAWMLDDTGYVTEGSSSNAWILTGEGQLITRQADTSILKGVTRNALMSLAASHGLTIEERPFTIAEAHAAREAFLSSATTLLLPVVSIDGRPVGEGRPGPFARTLRDSYLAYASRASDHLRWTA